MSGPDVMGLALASDAAMGLGADAVIGTVAGDVVGGAVAADAAGGAALGAGADAATAAAYELGAPAVDAAGGTIADTAALDAQAYGAGNAAGTGTGYAASGQAAGDLNAAAAASASGLPSWVSPTVQAGSKLATGMMQANTARKASATMAAADAKAGNENLAIYDKQQALQAPWVAAGENALSQLETGTEPGGQFNRAFSLADMQNSAVNPTYQFAKDESLAAMKNQAAAGGQNLSSNTIQGAGTLAGNLAAQYENQAFNQYQASNASALQPIESLAGYGQTATNQTQTAGQNYNTQQIPLTVGAGNATAAGQVAAGNATVAGIGGAINTVASSPAIMNSLASIFN